MELYQVLLKRGAGYITNQKAFVLKLAKQKLSRYYFLLKRLPVKSEEELDLSDLDIDLFLIEDGTEDYIIDKIIFENLWQILNSKPPETKKIFYLFYDLGLKIPEIAKELKLTESSVKNKLYRTVKELQNLLIKERPAIKSQVIFKKS